MTTLHDDVEIDRTQPGWLRRAWQGGLAREQAEPGGNRCGIGFLLRGRIPEVLEPYISTTPSGYGTRILHFNDLDSPAAVALLDALPESALEQDLSGYAPPASVMLRIVADNPAIRAGGSVIAPELPGEALQLRELTLLDPELLNGVPDVEPSELPAWIDELTAEDYTEYLEWRRSCLEHGITRQAWIRAVERYGIREARRSPYMRLVTNAETSSQGVWFAW